MACLILCVVAATAVGGACARLAGQVASARIWGGDRAPIAAKWCLVCYLTSSLLFSAISLTCMLPDRDRKGGGDRASVAILPHLIIGVLTFPLAFVGGHVGKLVGAVVGVFTSPFGSTWLDVAVSTSGQGCLIGIVVGVGLPWLILLKSLSGHPMATTWTVSSRGGDATGGHRPRAPEPGELRRHSISESSNPRPEEGR